MRISFLLLPLLLMALVRCDDGSEAAPQAAAPSDSETGPPKAEQSTAPKPALYSFQVQWVANREAAVNRKGGGYRIYYDTAPGSGPRTAMSVDVPYISGATAPVSVTVSDLEAGTYYVKVVAYSEIIAPGGDKNSFSAPTAEMTVTVP